MKISTSEILISFSLDSFATNESQMLFYQFPLFLLIFGFFINRKNVLTDGFNRPDLCSNVKWNSNESVVNISNATSSIWRSFFIDEKIKSYWGATTYLI